MSKSGISPMQPQSPQGVDPISYLIGSLNPRLTTVETQIAEWQETIAVWQGAALTYAKRVGIITGVWGLAVLVNAFPGTTVAHYADLLRLALMPH